MMINASDGCPSDLGRGWPFNSRPTAAATTGIHVTGIPASVHYLIVVTAIIFQVSEQKNDGIPCDRPSAGIANCLQSLNRSTLIVIILPQCVLVDRQSLTTRLLLPVPYPRVARRDSEIGQQAARVWAGT